MTQLVKMSDFLTTSGLQAGFICCVSNTEPLLHFQVIYGSLSIIFGAGYLWRVYSVHFCSLWDW